MSMSLTKGQTLRSKCLSPIRANTEKSLLFGHLRMKILRAEMISNTRPTIATGGAAKNGKDPSQTLLPTADAVRKSVRNAKTI